MLGLHDEQLHIATTDGQAPFVDGYARDVDGRLVLQGGEDLLGLWLGQFPKGEGFLFSLTRNSRIAGEMSGSWAMSAVAGATCVEQACGSNGVVAKLRSARALAVARVRAGSIKAAPASRVFRLIMINLSLVSVGEIFGRGIVGGTRCIYRGTARLRTVTFDDRIQEDADHI
jgi:hypothetical protein